MEERRKATAAAPNTQRKDTETSANMQRNCLNILAGVLEGIARQEIFSAKNLGYDEYEICFAENLPEPVFTVKSLGAGAFPPRRHSSVQSEEQKRKDIRCVYHCGCHSRC